MKTRCLQVRDSLFSHSSFIDFGENFTKTKFNNNQAESQSLLFYDWNSEARQELLGKATNMRLSTRDEFRRTGMAGAKLAAKNKIETADSSKTKARRRPTTSHFRGGDRLPSRAVKTRDKSKRIRIGIKQKEKKVQQQQSPSTKLEFSNERDSFQKQSPIYHQISESLIPYL
jgi:hypothetical protein